MHVKVGNMGTAISKTKLMDKWAASKRTQVSAILCIKLLPLLENALKLNFKALYETENLDPLQGPTHTLTPSSIHTQNRPKNYGWIYHLLSSVAYFPTLSFVAICRKISLILQDFAVLCRTILLHCTAAFLG